MIKSLFESCGWTHLSGIGGKKELMRCVLSTSLHTRLDRRLVCLVMSHDSFHSLAFFYWWKWSLSSMSLGLMYIGNSHGLLWILICSCCEEQNNVAWLESSRPHDKDMYNQTKGHPIYTHLVTFCVQLICGNLPHLCIKSTHTCVNPSPLRTKVP